MSFLSSLHVLVTGASGFIGSHLVDTLMAEGAHVTAIDNLTASRIANIQQHLAHPRFRFIKADLLDAEQINFAMRGQDLVCHLGAHSDIASAMQSTELDLRNTFLTTINVLEAMRLHSVKDLLFASSGSVYGEHAGQMSESSGPLLPISLYAASKLSSEAFISAYAYLFDVRALIFRFSNVVGSRLNRGVIYDFIRKLQLQSHYLEVLGNGKQRKPYMVVDDCIQGMLYAYQRTHLGSTRPCQVINLGTSTTTSVAKIADIVINELGLLNVDIYYTGGQRGWPGDQPRVELDMEIMRNKHWHTRYTSDEAVRVAAKAMISDRLAMQRQVV